MTWVVFPFSGAWSLALPRQRPSPASFVILAALILQLGRLASGGAAVSLIFEGQGSSSSSAIDSIAFDPDFSPPGKDAVTTDTISVFPYSGTAIAGQGLSFTKTHFDLSNSSLSITFQQARSGSANAYAIAEGTLAFKPNYDLHYSLSGQYEAAGRPWVMVQNTGLGEFTGSGLGLLLFGATNSNQINDTSSNTVFTVGGAEGAVHTYRGALEGTLFAGTAYGLQYDDEVNTSPITDSGVTAQGNVLLGLSLLGDMNGDGSVGFDDLVILARHYGQSGATYSTGDLNGNGTVGFEDLLLLVRHYGLSIPTATAELGQQVVPEPAPALAVAAAIVLLHRSRREQHERPAVPSPSRSRVACTKSRFGHRQHRLPNLRPCG